MAQKFLRGIDISGNLTVDSHSAVDSTVFDIQGSQGQLFSITNSLSGDLFSVSDISGIPILNVNSSGLVTVDGNLNIGDSHKIQLGDSQDLQIYHDGSNSYIDETGTGGLYLKSSAIRLQSAGGENMIYGVADSGVYIYHNNVKKFETTSTGVTVTGGWVTSGVSVATANVEHTDNTKALFGTGNDLQIYHDGSNSYVENETGNLTIFNKQNGGDVIFATDNGSGGTTEYFRLDGSTEQNVVSKNMRFEDNIQAQFGAGTDLRIYHDGNNSYIKDTGTGTLNIQGSTQVLISGANGEIGVQYVENVGVGLRHNNVQKLATTSTGVDVTGSSSRFLVDSATASAIDIGYYSSVRTIRALETGGSNLRPLAILSQNFNVDSSGNATFAGKITAPKLSIQNQINTTSSNLEINYENGDGTTTNFKDFYIRDGKNAVILNIQGSSKNATFAGDITSVGLTVDYTGNRTGDAGILVTNDSSDWGIKVDKDGTTDYGILSQTDGDNAIVVRNAAGTTNIQLQGDGDATFAGEVTLNGTDGHINLDGNNAAIFDNSNNNNAYYVRNGGSNSATLQIGTGSPGSNIKLTLDGSGNATFAGDVSAQGFHIDAATLQSFQDFQSKPIDTDSGLFTVGGHGMALGYSRAISLWSTTDGVYRSWVGTNLRWDGTNYKRASNHQNNNWGNIAGILFTGNSAATGAAMSFIIDPPENASGTGEATIGTTLPAGYTALTINNDLSAIFAGRISTTRAPGSNNTDPTLAFGDGNTGLYERQDNDLRVTLGGVNYWELSANCMGNVNEGKAHFNSETATATNPSIIPWRNDADTGIGRGSANVLSLIAGGVEALSLGTTTATFAGSVTVGGDLIVNGTTTTLNTTTVEVEDNILQLNTTQGSPDTATAATSGISIYRGDGVTQASLIFDDGDDTWDLTNNLKVAGSTTFSGNVTLSSTAPILYLVNTTPSTGKTWRFSSAANGNAYITQDGVIDAITLSHTSGNATFAGDIAAVNANITTAIDVGSFVYVGGNNSIFAENNLRFKSSGAAYIDHNTTSQSIHFRTSVSSSLDTTPLILTGANATFAGRIKQHGADTQTNVTASSDFGIELKNTSDTDGNFIPIDFFNSTGFVTGRIGAEFQDAGDRNTDLFFCTRANSGSLTEALRINSSQNTTFAGGIQVNGPGSYNTIKSANDYTLGFKDSNNVSQWWIKTYTNGAFALHENTVGDKFTIAAGGAATFAGTITAGAGAQAINADADLTLRNTSLGFVGIDFKSNRTSGNIGGVRYYGTASDSVPVGQLLVETDGALKYYNGTNGAQLRLTINSSGNATFAGNITTTGLQVNGATYLDVMPDHQSEGIIRIGRYDANTSRYHDIKSYVSSTAASNYLKFSLHGGTENAVADVLTLKGDLSATFAGNITANNFSGSSEGTNTGDQTLPTASSLGAVTITGTQTISGAKTFSNTSNHYNGHLFFDAYSAGGDHYPHFLDGSSNSGATINWRQYYGSNYKTHTWTSDASGNMGFTYQGAIIAVGSLTATGLDINGNADISGNLSGVDTLTATTLSVTNYGLASSDIPNNAANTTGSSGSCTGNAATATSASSAAKLTDGGGISTHPGTNNLIYTGALGSTVSGLFTASDNSNSILTVNRHTGDYNSQLGFSSNGNLYYRKFSGSTAYTTQGWKTLAFTDTDITGDTTGNAATATNVAYSGLTGTVPTWNQNTTGSSGSCTGNAATATTASAVAWGNITSRPYIEAGTVTSATATTTVASVVHATYTAAFFDFVIKNGTNVRSGTVYACHDGTTVSFTETSTVDLGDTSDVTLNARLVSTNMVLEAITTSSTWTIKTLTRAI